MTTIAKEMVNNNNISKATIIHFYGRDSYFYTSEMLRHKKGEIHPYDYLISKGFRPVSDLTWIL